MYASKFGVSASKMLERLWGENYFHGKKTTWTKARVEGSERGFNLYVLEPIYQVWYRDKSSNEGAYFVIWSHRS